VNNSNFLYCYEVLFLYSYNHSKSSRSTFTNRFIQKAIQLRLLVTLIFPNNKEDLDVVLPLETFHQRCHYPTHIDGNILELVFDNKPVRWMPSPYSDFITLVTERPMINPLTAIVGYIRHYADVICSACSASYRQKWH